MTVKEPAVPTVKVVLFALVMTGAVPLMMVSVTCAAFESLEPFDALYTNESAGAFEPSFE